MIHKMLARVAQHTMCKRQIQVKAVKSFRKSYQNKDISGLCKRVNQVFRKDN